MVVNAEDVIRVERGIDNSQEVLLALHNRKSERTWPQSQKDEPFQQSYCRSHAGTDRRNYLCRSATHQ